MDVKKGDKWSKNISFLRDSRHPIGSSQWKIQTSNDIKKTHVSKCSVIISVITVGIL